jgi:hypothetical protein
MSHTDDMEAKLYRSAIAARSPRPLYQIAAEIKADWATAKSGVYFGAVPYLEAMASLVEITDNYFEDSAALVVIYFLANANTWRGETARRVKAELKKMAGIK